MSQSIVTIRLNGQPYQMGCDTGQEDHIEALGREVDGVIGQLTQSVGQIGEARLLAMAALIIADKQPSTGAATEATEADGPAGPAAATVSIEQLDDIAGQLEVMTSRVNQLTAHLAKLS